MYAELQTEIRGLTNMSEIAYWLELRKPELDTLPEDWKGHLREQYKERKAEIRGEVVPVVKPYDRPSMNLEVEDIL